MKRWSRLVALLAVLAMVMGACGGDGGSDTTAGGPDTTAETPDTTAETPDTTTPPDTTGGTDTTAAPGGDIATDIGVDLEAGTITIGLLSDLSGPFSPLVKEIVTGHEVYWENVNANGGVNGLEVVLVIEDNAYDVPTHLQKYEEIRGEVAAIGHSTGSPHTVAALPEYIEDNILAVPLTWYSGWTDPQFNSNLMHHGTPYCLEAQNAIAYMSEDIGGASTIAIASIPGDYGLDGAAGAAIAAEALGLEVVYDGTGLANPTPGGEASLTEVANGIAASGADLVFFSATPGAFASVYGQAVAQGFEAKWTGTSPSWSPAFVAPDSQIRDAIARDLYITTYVDEWDGESEGAQEFTALMQELRPDAPPLNYYNEGYVEAKILHDALLTAYDNGDMTRAGILAAAKSLENVEFGGLAHPETYVGEPNEQVQRHSFVMRPDLEAPTGSVMVNPDYVADIVADFQFDEACYQLEG
ncbi:MAG TPA: ABC transporter substrate-binding protein [Acidimicrobiia bacterium]|nr:ABC transporter substrate-binding protein [Acidimicrobiia bacterium]